MCEDLILAYYKLFIYEKCYIQPNLYITNNSKEVVLDRWSSYKKPLLNNHKPNLVALGRFLVFIPIGNVFISIVYMLHKQ